MKKWFFIAIILTALLPSCVRLQDIKFVGIENIKVGKVGLSETTMQVNLLFNNPNNVGATLENAAGKAWVQNVYLGDFLMAQSVHIPAKSNFSVPVELKLNVGDLVSHTLSFIAKDSLQFKVDGAANLSKASFAKSFPIRFTEKRPTQELLNQIKF